MISDDATYMSSLTLDSSFPTSTRTHYPKVITLKPNVKAADDSEEKVLSLSNNSNTLAYMKLALRIKQIQAKLRLAKIIEEVYQQSMHETTSDNDQSFVLPEDEIRVHDERSHTTSTSLQQAALGSFLASSPPRPSTPRNLPFISKWSHDNESDCWSYGTSVTFPSLDTDLFHQRHEVSPILEAEGEDSTYSSCVSRRSGQSLKSGMRMNSRISAASRPRGKSVAIPLVDVDNYDLEDEEFPKRAGELLVGFP